jgi:hypothetical protein
MADFRNSPPGRSSRREVLKGLGITTAASVGAALGNQSLLGAEPSTAAPLSRPSGESAHRHLISGMDPKNLADEYARRELDEVSDAELCRQAAAIVSRPPVKGGGSFSLHAPLELLARYGLLPLVDPQERKLARLQLIASAAEFETDTTPGNPPQKITPFPSPADAQAEFARTFQKGDRDGLEAIALQFAAQYGKSSLVHLLTPLALPTLTGASHSHIGLWLLLRHSQSGDVSDAALLRAAARALAGGAGSQLKSFKGMAIEGTKPVKNTPAEIEKLVLEKLATAPRGKQAYGSMVTLITAGEKTGNADALFGDFILHDLTDEQIDAAFRAILRTCAHNMLQHGPQFAKFGWSHCLTLPQAACGLSSLNMNRKLALAAAFVWITAYRSVLSDHDLDLQWSPKPLEGTARLREALQTSPDIAAARVWHADPLEFPQIRQTLATQASIRTDQHLIKYTRACLDMVGFDPQHEKLYLAAAAHLCGLWTKESPEQKIKDGYFRERAKGRGT